MRYIVILVLSIILSSSYAVPVTNGLLAYYNFNSNISDSSGNNTATTAAGNAAAVASSGYGTTGGLVLDGVGDYVSVTNIPLNSSVGGSNTISFWMKWDGVNSQMPIGFSNYDLWLVDGAFGFNSNQGDVLGISSSGLANNWVYVTAIFYNGAPSASTFKLFINGVEQTITLRRGSTSVSWPTTNYFYMGTYGYSTSSYNFKGSLDEVAVYNRALTNSEVSQLYTSYTTPEPSVFLLLVLGLGASIFAKKRK